MFGFGKRGKNIIYFKLTKSFNPNPLGISTQPLLFKPSSWELTAHY